MRTLIHESGTSLRTSVRQLHAKLGSCLCALLALVSMACSLVGCGGGQGETIAISEDDPELVYARQSARNTLNQFIYSLQNPRPGQTLFAVKAKFEDDSGVEYMWLTDLRYENGEFVGVVNNEPSVVSNIRMGQEYRVAAYAIDDWMILDNEQIVGGYSVNIVAARQATDTNLR